MHNEKILINSFIPKQYTISQGTKLFFVKKYEGISEKNIASDDLKLLDKFQKEAKGIGTLVLKTNRNRDPVFNNVPMQARLIGTLSKREKNGTGIYAVLLENKYIVPIEHDVLLDCVLHKGIDKNGMIKSNLIVAKKQKKCQLIRFDSNLHKSILNFMEYSNSPKVKLEQLEQGRVYSAANGKNAVFIGYVSTTKYSSTSKEPYLKKEQKSMTLWFDLRSRSIEDNCQEYFDLNKEKIFYFSLRERHNFIAKTNVKIDIKEPFLIYKIADKFYKLTKTLLEESGIWSRRGGSDEEDCINYEDYIIKSIKNKAENKMTYIPYRVESVLRNSKFFNMGFFGIDLKTRERTDLLKMPYKT